MKNLKVVTIAPQLTDVYFSEELGICSITAVLREAGYKVLLKPIIKDKEDYTEIIEFGPDVIGITSYNQTIELVYKICRDLKKALPNTFIFIGGYASTYHAKEILTECNEIDGAILGEGERAVIELMDRLKKQENYNDVNGLASKNKMGEIIVNPRQEYIENLDELPFPSRDLMGSEGLTIVCSTRGCMRNCFFCCGNDFWKRENKYSWRAKSIGRFVDEIEYLVKEHNRNQFWIVDASWEDPGFNEKRMCEFAEEILRRNLKISYFVLIRATFYKFASKKLMKLLTKSGLCEVFIGTEAANSHDLKVLGKNIKVEDNVNCIDFFKKYDIYPEIGFINFNPYSNFEGLRQNAEFLEEQGFAAFFRYISRVRIYKGSIMHDILEKDGLLKQTKFYDDDGYNYKDKRIERLVEYLVKHQALLEKEANLSGELTPFERYYGDKLSHLKMHFKLDKNEDAIKLIEEHKSELDKILSDLNILISKWYKKLLDLAENSWNVDVADRLCAEYLPPVSLREIFDRLRMERIRFLRNLARLDKELMKLIRA